MGKTILVEIADHDDRSAENTGGSGRSKTDRACTGNIDGGANTDARLDRAVEAGRQNIREHGQVADLRHRPVAIREFQQVEVGIGDRHIFRLATDPAAHIHITVGAAGAGGVHRQADAGILRLAAAATAAGHVERHGNDVANLQHLDVDALLDDFAGDFVTKNEARHCRGAAAHHVLVGAADIGGNNLENDAVLDPAAIRRLKLRVVDVADLDLTRPHVDDASVPAHIHLLHG